MGVCEHGINLKHRRCEGCETIARMESNCKRIVQSMKPPDNGQQSSFTDVDPDRLDEEWMKQPGLYHRYAVQQADARRKHAEAKAEQEVIEAEVALKIRKSPEVYLFDVKATEASIAACVLTQDRYKAAVLRTIEVKHAVDVLEAAVWALDHKKKALENLVQLRMGDYYSSPRKPANVSVEAVEQMQKDARRRKIDNARPERK